jgi:hypothetical protein
VQHAFACSFTLLPHNTGTPTPAGEQRSSVEEHAVVLCLSCLPAVSVALPLEFLSEQKETNRVEIRSASKAKGRRRYAKTMPLPLVGRLLVGLTAARLHFTAALLALLVADHGSSMSHYIY